MEILIQRKKNRVYKIVPVSEDDTLMSKKKYFEMLDRGLQSIKKAREKNTLRNNSKRK